MRMRPLLLRTSAAAAMHHATIRHGLRRLVDLKHQMQGLLAHMNKLQQAAVSEQQSTAAAAAAAAWHSVTGATPGKQQHAGLASGTPTKLKVMARRQVCWYASASRLCGDFCLLVLCCLMLKEINAAGVQTGAQHLSESFVELFCQQALGQLRVLSVLHSWLTPPAGRQRASPT